MHTRCSTHFAQRSFANSSCVYFVSPHQSHAKLTARSSYSMRHEASSPPLFVFHRVCPCPSCEASAIGCPSALRHLSLADYHVPPAAMATSRQPLAMANSPAMALGLPLLSKLESPSLSAIAAGGGCRRRAARGSPWHRWVPPSRNGDASLINFSSHF